MKQELRDAYKLREDVEIKSSHYLNAFSVLGIAGVFKLLGLNDIHTTICNVDILKIALLSFAASIVLNLLSWFMSIRSIDEYIAFLKKEVKEQCVSEWPHYILVMALFFAILGLIVLVIDVMYKI